MVKLMKPVVAASSHVLGNKKVDEGKDFWVSFSEAFDINWTASEMLWFYTVFNTVILKNKPFFLLTDSSAPYLLPIRALFMALS